MSPTLPPDFPPELAQGLESVKKIHAGTYNKVLEFIGLNWGDIGAIDKAIAIWEKEATEADQSLARVKREFTQLTSNEASEYWEGGAREAYATWQQDFIDNTLAKYSTKVWDIKKALEAIKSNILSIRGHVVAMVIEIIGAIVGAASSNPVGYGAAILAALALLGTWADFQFRVKGDLDDKGAALEDIKDQDQIKRSDGSVSLPFSIQVIGDWDNWQNKKPLTVN
jgi:uncharacterized protein YukE